MRRGQYESRPQSQCAGASNIGQAAWTTKVRRYIAVSPRGFRDHRGVGAELRIPPEGLRRLGAAPKT
jgi:hypothetical protein